MAKTKAREFHPPVCARCGEKRQASGFRFYVNGVGYCDPCFNKQEAEPKWQTGAPWTWNNIVYQVTETY